MVGRDVVRGFIDVPNDGVRKYKKRLVCFSFDTFVFPCLIIYVGGSGCNSFQKGMKEDRERTPSPSPDPNFFKG